MGDTPFLNLEYILLKFYTLFSGVSADASQIPSQVTAATQQLALAGLALAFIFLVLAVWARIRLVLVEHEGFHKKEEAERKVLEREASVGKNGRWERVMTLAASSEPANWRRAVIEADVMLSDLLTEHGYAGEGVGEQLRGANPFQFTTLDLAWQAHKVRNEIAHRGEEYELSEREMHATIDLYARVFEEFGYI